MSRNGALYCVWQVPAIFLSEVDFAVAGDLNQDLLKDYNRNGHDDADKVGLLHGLHCSEVAEHLERAEACEVLQQDLYERRSEQQLGPDPVGGNRAVERAQDE